VQNEEAAMLSVYEKMNRREICIVVFQWNNKDIVLGCKGPEAERRVRVLAEMNRYRRTMPDMSVFLICAGHGDHAGNDDHHPGHKRMNAERRTSVHSRHLGICPVTDT
jgi:hypothetical protein